MRRRLGILSGVCIVVLALSTVPALADIQIGRIRFNPPGEDGGSNASRNQEIIRIENTGARAVSLRGWTIHTAEHLAFHFPRFRLGAGRAVSIHSGEGDDSQKHLYWDLTIYAWDNDAGAAALWNGRMRRIDTCSYTGGGVSVIC